MSELVEKVWSAIKATERDGGYSDSKDISRAAIEAVFDWLEEPSDSVALAVRTVVQITDDPSADDSAIAERVCASLGASTPAGELACAELVRDWRNMLAQLRAETLP